MAGGAVSIASSESLDKGLKSGRARACLEHRHRHRFHSSRLQPGCDARPCHCHGWFSRATRCNRCICADAADLDRLQRAQQGRPGLRDDLHLGNAEPSDRRRAGRAAGESSPPIVLVMASLAEVAGQYGFLLFNANGIGNNPTSPWVLLVGVLWIVVLAYICYRGIEVSAWVQRVLLAIELVMLAVYAIVAIIRVAVGHAPPGHMVPTLSWFNPTTLSLNSLVDGLVLMLFILLGLGHFALGERGDE